MFVSNMSNSRILNVGIPRLRAISKLLWDAKTFFVKCERCCFGLLVLFYWQSKKLSKIAFFDWSRKINGFFNEPSSSKFWVSFLSIIINLDQSVSHWTCIVYKIKHFLYIIVIDLWEIFWSLWYIITSEKPRLDCVNDRKVLLNLKTSWYTTSHPAAYF